MKRFIDLQEATGTVSFTFGRFNPPTTGHEKLCDAVKKANPSDYKIFVSHKQDPKTDPLEYSLKVAYMQKSFPKHKRNIIVSKSRNIFEILVELNSYENLIMVVGSDRVAEFKRIINEYNGVKSRHGFYEYKTVKVLSAGERDPDAEGVTGMSASKMRAAAVDSDFDSFKLGTPLNDTQAKKLYFSVRKSMGIREELNLSDLDTLRDLYLSEQIWNVGDLIRVKSKNDNTYPTWEIIRRGTNYVTAIDENYKSHKVWLHDIDITEVKQDKDVKDKEGTQPAKYYAGDMAKSTKDKRDAHFKKKKSGPAPGDTTVKTKPSVHTKKFKDMFGEEFKFYPKDLEDYIQIPDFPTDDVKEMTTIRKLINMRTDKDVESVANNDEDSFYSIKEYLKKMKVEFHEGELKDIVQQAVPTIRYFKNKFNRKRPFELDGNLDVLGSKTNKTRSYPSGHSTQAMIVALYVAQKFPKHRDGLMEAAKEVGMGRVKAGFHYLSDHIAGQMLGQKMFEHMNKEDYGKSFDVKEELELDENIYTKSLQKASDDFKRRSDDFSQAGSKTSYSVKFAYLAGLMKTKNLTSLKRDLKGFISKNHNIKDIIVKTLSKYLKPYEVKSFTEESDSSNSSLREYYLMGTPEYDEYLKKLTPGEKVKENINEWGEIDEDAEYQGRKVKLNNPTKGDIKKFKVYVRNDKGNVIKVEFGDPNMDIKRDSPERLKAFRARHNCDQKKDKTTAGYWSCKFWEKGKTVTDLMKG